MNTREIFYNNLNKFINMSGKNKKTISEEMGLPYTTLAEWANGKKFPRADGIERLATYFNIEKSDLLEEKSIAKHKNIGRLIYTRRNELNLTLEEVANAVGVSVAAVEKWESGFITNIESDVITALAKVLQISPVLLIDDSVSSINKNFTVFAMDGIPGKQKVTVNEEKSEKLAQLLRTARDLPDDKIDMLLKMADSIK